MLLPHRLRQRAAIIQSIRRFFVDRGFLEVDTPLLLPACAPEAHIEPIRAGELFLQTSPELCMKRLLASGCNTIFQICKCFRANERGSRHLPEFTMLEWYRAKNDYRQLMTDCEALLTSVISCLQDNIPPGTTTQTATALVPKIDLSRPWERITVAVAFDRHGAVSLADALADDTFEEILCRDIEPHLGQPGPTILYDYPAQLGALARLKPDAPEWAERFEVYINGVELANGFSELSDPAEQRQRFVAERRLIAARRGNPGPMPEPFLADLERMPAAAGIAMGLDRLVMLLLGEESIDRAITFLPEEL